MMFWLLLVITMIVWAGAEEIGSRRRARLDENVIDLHDRPECGDPTRADVFNGVWCACERGKVGIDLRADR